MRKMEAGTKKRGIQELDNFFVSYKADHPLGPITVTCPSVFLHDKGQKNLGQN